MESERSFGICRGRAKRTGDVKQVIANNKIKYLALLTLGIAALLMMMSLFVIGPPVTGKEWLSLFLSVGGYSATFTVVIAAAFDKWLWKFLPDWLLGIPKIYGTWKGDLKSHRINPETKKDVHKTVAPYFLSIRQTFS